VSVFADLVGQSEAVDILKNAVVGDGVAMTQSWLFTGPPGSGRSNAALAFATALVCYEGGCGECSSCKTAKYGSHPDVELIRTEGLSIKIDEVREIIMRASWEPTLSAYRVIVMEDADRLTESAANALLKAIEEPGVRTVWYVPQPWLMFCRRSVLGVDTFHCKLHLILQLLNY
jgi:DNA polymerase-3 subunit delta'